MEEQVIHSGVGESNAVAVIPRKQRVKQQTGTMAPRFRLFLSPDDETRIQALQVRYDTTNLACLIRVIFERVMVNCPDEGRITAKFAKLARRADEDLCDRAFSEGRSVGIEMGERFHPYAVNMASALNFDSTARFVRAVILMVERGDV